MKEFAGIDLVNLKISDSAMCYRARQAFFYNYSVKYSCSPGYIDPGEIIQHVENCLQINLTLPISCDESLAIALKYLPADKYLVADSRDNLMIRLLKQALQIHEYKESTYKEYNLRDRMLAVAAIKKTLTLQGGWVQTVEIICNSISSRNLAIALDNLNKIQQMQNNLSAVTNVEHSADIFSLQLSHYLKIIAYLELRLELLDGPFYTQHSHLYFYQTQRLYTIALDNAFESLDKLQKLPEIVKNHKIDLKKDCLSVLIYSYFFKKSCLAVIYPLADAVVKPQKPAINRQFLGM